MSINKLITKWKYLIFCQILVTYSLRKCIETSLENLYVNIGDERVNMKQLGVLLLPLNRMLEQQGHIIQIFL